MPFCNILFIINIKDNDSQLSLSLVIETLLFYIQLWKYVFSWHIRSMDELSTITFLSTISSLSAFHYSFHPHYSHQFQSSDPHQNQANPHYQFQSSQQYHLCHMIAKLEGNHWYKYSWWQKGLENRWQKRYLSLKRKERWWYSFWRE